MLSCVQPQDKQCCRCSCPAMLLSPSGRGPVHTRPCAAARCTQHKAGSNTPPTPMQAPHMLQRCMTTSCPADATHAGIYTISQHACSVCCDPHASQPLRLHACSRSHLLRLLVRLRLLLLLRLTLRSLGRSALLLRLRLRVRLLLRLRLRGLTERRLSWSRSRSRSRP